MPARLNTDRAAIFVALLACRLLAAIPCPLYDDAFITMRYAENLAAGRGLVYNPGAPWEPVFGTTTPGYTFLLAAGAWAGFDLPTLAIGINALCDALIAMLLFGICERTFARETPAASPLRPREKVGGGFFAAAAIALFALLPQTNRISAGGMESPLFVLTVLVAMRLAAGGAYAWAGFVGALAAVVRPEGVLVPLVLAASYWRTPSRLIRTLVPAAAVGVLYVVLATAYFGQPVPQSVLAKAAKHGGDLERVVLILREGFAPHIAFVPLLPVLAVGIWRCLRRPGEFRLFTAFVLLLMTAYLTARPKMWGWYFYPVLVADCIWIGVGVAWLAARFTPRFAATVESSRHWLRWTWPAVCAAGVAVVALQRGPSPVQTELYAGLREWTSAHCSSTTTILAGDIGAVGYYSHARILDSAGLVWPAALHERDEAALVARYRPDYVFVTTRAAQRVLRQAEPAYEFVRRFGTVGTATTAWRQEYELYARAVDDWVPPAGARERAASAAAP
jgi:hypothetical protein